MLEEISLSLIPENNLCRNQAVALVQCPCWLLERYDSQGQWKDFIGLRGRWKKSREAPFLRFRCWERYTSSAPLPANFKHNISFKLTQLPRVRQNDRGREQFLESIIEMVFTD